MAEVLSAPDKAQLAISTGAVRRQVDLEVNKPFNVPHHGERGPLMVNLLQPIGCKELQYGELTKACDTEGENGRKGCVYSVPVQKRDGSQTEVQLQVRPKETNGESPPQSPKRRPQSPTKNGLIHTSDQMRDYLDTHQLQERVQMLLSEVLKAKPENPFNFMVEQLKMSRDKQVLAAPVPPLDAAESGSQPRAEADYAHVTGVVLDVVFRRASTRETPINLQVDVVLRRSIEIGAAAASRATGGYAH